MASTPEQRQLDERAAFSARFGLSRVHVLAAVAALVVAAVTVSAVLAQLAGWRTPEDPATPGFLATALGAPQADAPLVREPDAGIRVTIDETGFTVTHRDASLGVSSDRGSGPWTTFEHGAVRATPYGSETITVEQTKTEQYLTVVERQGKKTWRWRLETTTLEPTLRLDGAVELLGATGENSGITILPAAILDSKGRNITAASTRWSLDRDDHGWLLELALDDSLLPLPYVIDPASAYPSPLELRNTATSETGSWDLDSGTGAIDMNTANVPAQNATGWYAFNPGVSNTTQLTTLPTTTDGSGWIVDPVGGATGFPAGTWSFAVQTDIPNGTFTTGTAVMTVGVWKGTVSGGVFTPTGTILSPTDDPAAQNIRPNVSTNTVTVSYSLSKIALAAGETLFVDYWRHQTGGINATQAPRRQLDFYVNDGVAQITHPAADDAGPTHSVSLAPSPTGAHYAGGRLYYKSDAAGSFAFRDALTDTAGTGTAASGVLDLDYPAIATTGWTHTVETVTTSPNYQSSSYSWTANPGNPANQTLTAEDNALQQSTSVVQFVADTTAPTGAALTVNGVAASGGAGATSYDTTGSFTIGTRTDYAETQSGTAAGLLTSTLTRENGTLSGNGCSAYGAPITLVGAPAQGPFATGCYRYTLTGTDNVGNAVSITTTVKVDTTGPSVASVTVGSVSNANDSYASGSTFYYRPAGSGGTFDVATVASDGDSGLGNASYPALAGGFTPASSAGIAPPSPYSRTYTWPATSGTDSGLKTVSVANNAGGASTQDFRIVSDSTAPAGGALTVNGVVASGSGTTGYDTDGSFTIGTRTDYAETLSATAAGFRSSTLTREDGTLFADACSSYGGPATLVGTPAQNGLAASCYRYTLTGTDNVGNTVAVSTVVKVDTTAPTSAADALSTYATSTPITVGYTAGDAATGVDSVQLWVDGPGAGGYALADTDTTPASPSFSYTASEGDGVYRFYTRARDNAGNTEVAPGSEDTTTVVDTTNPTSAADALPAFTGTTSIAVTYTSSDTGGSGVDEVELWAKGPSDGAYVLADTDTTPGSASFAYTASQGEGTYRFYTRAGDVAGNTEVAPGSEDAVTVLETSPPTAPLLSFGSFTNASATGTTVFVREGAAGGFTVTADATDPDSGVAGHAFPSFWGEGGSVASDPAAMPYTFAPSDTAPFGVQTVTATNGAGLMTAGTGFTVVADTLAPVTTPSAAPAPNGNGWHTSQPVDVTLAANDGGSGVAAIRYTTDGSDPTALSPLYSGTIAVTSMTTVKFRAWDAVGNVEAVGSLLVRIDTTTPSVPTLALAETDPGSYVSGTTLFYNPSGANSGTFTVDATASDSESGVDKVAFPALAGMTGGGDDTSLAFHGSYAWTSSSTASGAQTVTAHNGAGLTSSGSFTLVQDTTAPTSTIACDGAACSAGWYTSSPVSVSLAASDGGSGLASLRYTLDGSDPVGGTPYTGAFDVAATATVRWAALDQVGNLHTGSELVRIDTTAPSSPNLSFDSFTNASATGSTVFFRPGATGGFTVTATTADGGSGLQHVAFPALGANWTGGGNDASAPYAQAYTFAASAADPAEPNDVVARNGAGLDSAATPFTVTADATAPTTTIACDGVPCPGGWTTSAADVTLSADDGPGSGVSEIRYTLDGTDPLASGTLSSGPFGVAATTTVRFAAVDAVGNAEAAGSQLLQIDDSKPTTPTLAFSAPTNAHWDGSVLWFRAGATGGFTVTPSSSDPQSGVATYHFPALGSGWSNAGGAYTFAGVAADPAEPNDVTAENAAGLVSDPVGFTVTADGAAPIGASVNVTGGATATLSVAVATDAGTDAGSGVDTGSLVVERQEADLDNGDGTCDAFGSWTTVTPTAGADTGVVSGTCYRYRVRSFDLVGNEATSAASATVQVDTAAPGVTLDDPGANLAGAVTLSATAMDAASGIASVAFQRSPADAGTWTTITGSWDTTGVADGLYDLRAIGTDGAGNTATSPVVEDRRVDNTSPDTTIETAPADPDNDATPTFVFSSTESGSTFQCRFDGGAWGGCASPLTTGALPDGARTFEVRAVDASANPDPTPASHSWVLDMIAPSGGSITIADGWDTDGAVAIATDNGTDIGGSGVAAASTIVEREAATLTTGTCGSFDAAWSAVATPDASVAGGACYRYRLRVRDHAGNWATYPSASVVKVDLTAPAVPALALANVAGTQVVGTTAYFRPGASGSFTVTPAATDPESGGVTFIDPNLGTGWSRVGTTWSFDATAGDPNEPNNVTATNAAGLTSTAASFTVTADAAAPGTTATAAPAVNGFGWHTASPVSVTLTAADGDSGAKEIRYTTDSSVPGPTSPLYSAPVDVVALGTTTVTFRAEDNVGNLEAPATIVVRVDTTAPTTPTLSYSGLANASFDGTVTWFRPGAAGGFTVTPTAGDPESGAASHVFPALGSDWSNTGGTYAFTAAAADPVEPNEVVTTNGAGLASAGAPITVTADSTAPVSTATCDAAACSAGWYTTKPVTVVLTASDAQSGLDRTDWSTDGAAPANEYLAPLSLGAEGATTVRVSARDNVGNVEATVSQDVRIDTVAPTASIGAVAPYLHGTVALTSTQSDATSGVGSVQFQTAPAGTGTWTNVPATWDTTGTANGQYDVHVRVTDVAGNVADSTPVASVWVDNLAPVLALDPPASPASGSVLLTSTANDAHSGLDTIDYEYSAAGANDWRTTALTGALWDTTQLVDGAYDVRARAADRSGNVSGWSVVNGIAVDNAPPTVSVTAPLDGSFVNGAEADPFTLAAAASDAGSGVASVEFLACATTGSTCSSWTSIDLDTTPAYTGAWTLPGDGVRQVKAVATDNAGHTSEAGVTVTVDRTAPATSLTAPSAGANVRGTFPLTASAADATSGVDSVDFQRSPAGASSWTTIATDSDGGDGWTGSLDTTLGGTPDGLYDMRVLVTDEAGNAQTDVAANVRVDNTAPTGTLTDPGQFLRGSLALSGTAADTGSGVASVAFQRSPESADTWTTIATDTNGGDGWSNSFDTTAGGTPDGRYDLRVLVTDNAGNMFTHTLPGRTIDNTRPTAAIANPGTNLRLAVTLGGTADDVTAGVATVAFEYDNGGGWQLISTDNDGSDGWSASLNTTLPATPDGLYAFRLTATDRAGNQETSQIGGRRIDNTAPTASLNDPGPYLMGAVQLAASATDGGSGIDVVRFERSATGSGGPWTQVGPDASFSGGAWRSTWNTNPDGLYDLRVVVDDLAGNRTIDVVASRRVDNTAPVTTDDAAPGRHNTNQTVTLSRSDAGSGPSTTQYRVRAPGGSFGAWQSGTSVAIFASAGDGVSTIEYFSTDAAGNVESVKSTDVLIDTTGPSGTVTDPSTFLRGLVALTATADDPTDVSFVTFEYAPEGTAAWTQIGTDLTASGSDEYTVDWDTTSVADIAYDLQVTFLDSLGNPTVQALTGKTVDNELPTIALTAPPAGAVRRNVIAITATAADGVSGMREVRFEVKPAGAAGFSQVDVDNGSSPYSTAWDSTASPDGPTDVRVIAVDQAGNLRSATTTIFVDNDAPTLTVSAPSTAVSGTVTLTATGSSDIQSVVFKVGGSPIGTDNDGSDGFSVAWSTVGDGNQVVTAEATDVGGNVGTSSPVTVQVDNTAPTGAMTMPGNGATLSGTVALAATASDAGSGVSGTSFEYKRTSDSTWTAIGGSFWNTTAVATGAYNVRARVTDNAGNSAPTAAITVQVVPPAPVVVPPAPPTATPAPPAPSDPAPSIVASTPADGSVLRASPASLGVTASEPLSAVAALTLNGSPVGATITGASFSIEPGELDTGAYTLAGTLVDATGKTTPFRLHFTVVLGSPATPPFVEANAPSGAATSLTAVDGASFVTVPAGAVSGGGDWLVVRIQPLPASSVPAATTGAPASVVDVSARWALAGTEVHSFRFPLEIALTAASASLVPATLEDGRWRALEPVPGGASLPLLSRDGYVREGDRVRILTRHLSVFALIPAPRLVLSVAAAKNFSWTTRRFVAARVKVSRAATVTATLVGPRGARLATWRRTVRAGASVLKLPMPQTARTPGAYRIVVAATAGGQRVQRTLGLRIVRKDGSQHAPGPVNVALAGDTRIRRTLARGLRGTDMRVIAADADGAFTLAANRGVRVVLVDVDRHGTALVRDLNAVFPTLRLLALASRSADLRAATRVGADAVLPRSASSTRIARAVRRLAR